MESTTNQKIMQAAKLSNLQTESKLRYDEILDEKTPLNRELRDDMKRREQEQTQELLICLTNELFERVEKISAKKKSNTRKSTKTKSPKTSFSKKESKIVFSDLSWYREKLSSKVDKNHES
jgi:hypothetical protein